MIEPIAWRVKEDGQIFNIKRNIVDLFVVSLAWPDLDLCISTEKTLDDAHAAIFKYINEGKK